MVNFQDTAQDLTIYNNTNFATPSLSIDHTSHVVTVLYGLSSGGAITENLSQKFTTTHGTNATSGVATLVSGTVTVSTTAIAALAAAGTAGDVVNLVLQNCSNCGSLSVGTVTAATSFVINSTNVLDASNVYWEIRHIN